METDREILIWFHERLARAHGESRNYDYMRRLRWIIRSIPKNKMSRGQQKHLKNNCNNSLKECLKGLKLSEFEKMAVNDSEKE